MMYLLSRHGGLVRRQAFHHLQGTFAIDGHDNQGALVIHSPESAVLPEVSPVSGDCVVGETSHLPLVMVEGTLSWDCER